MGDPSASFLTYPSVEMPWERDPCPHVSTEHSAQPEDPRQGHRPPPTPPPGRRSRAGGRHTLRNRGLQPEPGVSSDLWATP